VVALAPVHLQEIHAARAVARHASRSAPTGGVAGQRAAHASACASAVPSRRVAADLVTSSAESNARFTPGRYHRAMARSSCTTANAPSSSVGSSANASNASSRRLRSVQPARLRGGSRGRREPAELPHAAQISRPIVWRTVTAVRAR